MRRSMVAASMLMLLGACSASPATMSNLQAVRDACAVGDAQACNELPYAQQAANQEADANTTALAVGALLLPALVIVSAADGDGGGHHGGGHRGYHGGGWHHH